jgi:hypothetical protein
VEEDQAELMIVLLCWRARWALEEEREGFGSGVVTSVPYLSTFSRVL